MEIDCRENFKRIEAVGAKNSDLISSIKSTLSQVKLIVLGNGLPPISNRVDIVEKSMKELKRSIHSRIDSVEEDMEAKVDKGQEAMAEVVAVKVIKAMSRTRKADRHPVWKWGVPGGIATIAAKMLYDFGMEIFNMIGGGL